jgi:hypothetical protein
MGDPAINTSIDFLKQLRQSNNTNDQMSLLLMHILEVQISIAQNLNSTMQQTEETRQKVVLHDAKLADQEARIIAQESKIATLEQKIEEVTQALNDHKIMFEQQLQNTNKSVAELTDKNNYLEQWRIDNAIFLSGFTEKMDSNMISQQLASIYKIANKDLEYHYSFSIENFKGTKKFHYVVIGFANRQAKTNIFNQKKNMGKLFLQQLAPSAKDSGSTEIYISNRLTKNNLAIQKDLLELKKGNNIKRIVYKNCVLHAKIADDSALFPVKSYNDFDLLLEKLPVKMDHETETTEKPGASENSSIRKRLEGFHYKGN